MLFHVGTLWRLHELGYLGRLDRVSSVSGGSITAAVLGLKWHSMVQNGGAEKDSRCRAYLGLRVRQQAPNEGSIAMT